MSVLRGIRSFFLGLGRAYVGILLVMLMSFVLVGCVSDPGEGTGDGGRGDSDLVEVEYIK